MTATIETPATTAPVMTFTVPADDFTTALKNVALFADTDTTLPALCGVLLEMDAGGVLTFVATDRYVLAKQTLEPADDTHAGSGEVFIPAATVKALAAVKAPKYGRPLITVSVADGGALTVALPDATVVTYPAAEYSSFPKWRPIQDGFEACPAGDTPALVAYNPAFLGKFAKVKPGSAVSNPLKLTQGTQPHGRSQAAERGVVPQPTISRARCGPVTAYIMHVRTDS